MKEYKYKINGNLYKVIINDVEDNMASVEVNGTPYEIEMERKQKTTIPPVHRAEPAPKTETGKPIVSKPQPTTKKRNGVKAPLPGTILDIKVKVGDTVKRGDTVIILEAMKMENKICAHEDGTITEISTQKGETVLEGTDLVIIE